MVWSVVAEEAMVWWWNADVGVFYLKGWLDLALGNMVYSTMPCRGEANAKMYTFLDVGPTSCR